MSLPTYYVYEDSETWRKTNKDLTEQLNKIYCGFLPKQSLGNYCFYPQWDKPNNTNETKPAWRILPDGSCVQRWYWCARDHKNKHADCKMIGNGRCATKVTCRLVWSDKNKVWVLADMPDKTNIND